MVTFESTVPGSSTVVVSSAIKTGRTACVAGTGVMNADVGVAARAKLRTTAENFIVY